MMTKTCVNCKKGFETEKEEQVMCQECLAAATTTAEGQAPVAGTPEAAESTETAQETPTEPVTK